MDRRSTHPRSPCPRGGTCPTHRLSEHGPVAAPTVAVADDRRIGSLEPEAFDADLAYAPPVWKRTNRQAVGSIPTWVLILLNENFVAFLSVRQENSRESAGGSQSSEDRA
jgi:hypothetical protein